jgi:thiosulfate reductase/polysulfide reductase chain A
MEIKRAVCHFCKGRCRVLVHSENGRLVKSEWDKSFPIVPAIKGCVRRLKGSMEFQYHPDRLSFPLKRAGEKGDGKWTEISWEQAFDEIAEKMQKLIDSHGAETVAATNGTGRNFLFETVRFMNLLGSPNHCGQGFICWGPNAAVTEAMCGWSLRYKSVPKETTESTKFPTKCYFIVGVDPAQSFQRFFGELQGAKEVGAKIIVVDPRKTKTADMADNWLQIRPETDTALLLSMIKVIIEEDLYDHDFVDKWCYGFDKLKERASEYPPEKVAEITWIPADTIKEVARMCATIKPIHMVHGMGVEHQQNSIDAVQARVLLSAITGNIGIEGGETLPGPSPLIPQSEITCDDLLPKEQKEKQLGSDRWKLESARGHDTRQASIRKFWGQKCGSYRGAGEGRQPSVFEAMITGEPYPVKACLTVQSNPLVTGGNIKRVYKALKNLDLYVVLDYWLTPCAEIADYVLPIASWMERPFLHDEFGIDCAIWAGEQALPASLPGEYDRKTDWEVLRGIGTRLGQDWPWENLEQVFDHRLSPLGVTHQEFMDQGGFYFPKKLPNYEEMGGFGTPSGKLELYSTVLEKLDCDPLPSYKESFENPVSTPEIAEEYPLMLLTGGRFNPLFHSEFRQIDVLRKMHPHPIVQINPTTAADLDIKDGDWAWIQTPRGTIRMKCQCFKGIHPQVVHTEHGWWFPELPGEDPWLHGVWESNCNVLTETSPEACNRKSGGWPLRTGLCKVFKCKVY